MLKWDVLAVAIVYVLGTSLGLGLYQARKRLGRTADSFLYAEKSLSPWVAGAAIALAALGAVHTIGLMESGGTVGLATFWLCVTAAASMAWEAGFFAPYYRKLGVNTIPEVMDKLFDHRGRTIASIIGIAAAFVILTIETQGGGVVLAALTGIDVHAALILFMVMAIAYVMITGQWQVAYLDFINVIVTYICTVAAFIIISVKLPDGWGGVTQYYLSQGATDALRFWPKDPGLIFGFVIALVIVVFCFNPQDQGKMSYYICAKDVPTARKAGFIALFLNAPFGFFTTLIGFAAMALPQFAQHGPKLAGVQLTLDYLPGVLAGLLLAAFLVLVLSTWARFTMGISQVVINDFYLHLSKKPAAEKEKTVVWLSRVLILVPGIAAFLPAYSMPNILFTGIFGFGLGIPAFVMMALGLFWKRNATAALVTMWVTFLASFVWEFTPLRALMGLPGWFATPYVALLLSLVLGAGLTAALGGRPGLVRKQAGVTLGA